MATLGYRTMDEMVGQTQRLAVDETKMNYKSKGLDLSPLLLKVGVGFVWYTRIRDDGFMAKRIPIS
jgi:hypothetical protein